MVRDQRPAVALRLRFKNQIANPFYKAVAVLVVIEYLAPLDSPDNDMLDRTRCVNSRLSWHARFVS